MPDIILKNRDGDDVTYSGVETVSFDTPTEGQQAVYTYGVVDDNPEISLDLANGDQVVSVPDGTLVKTATIKKPGTLLPENIVEDVEIAGVVGTYKSLEINGLIEAYQVAAGENINAGDFLKFIEIATELNATNYSCRDGASAVLLDENRVFIAHAYSNSYHLYGTIVTISGSNMTATTTALNTTNYSCFWPPSAVLLEENKVFIAHTYGQSKYLYGTIVTISGATMTAKSIGIKTDSYSCQCSPSAVLVSTNKVFIAYAYGTSYALYGVIISISGTSLSVSATKSLNGTQYSCAYTPHAVLLDANNVFIAHAYSGSYYLYGTIVTISGTSMTATTTALNTASYSCRYAPSAVLLDGNRVFIAHSYGTYYLYGTIATLDGSSVTATSDSLNVYSYSCYCAPSVVLLGDGNVLISQAYSSTRKLYCTIPLPTKVVGYASQGNSIAGIAGTSGASGEIIDVYVPNPAN